MLFRSLVAPELGGSPAVHFEPRAYAASALTLLYLAQELPARYRTALLIAHNPGLSELAASLAAPPESDRAAGPASTGAASTGPAATGPAVKDSPRPAISLPTAAVAVFEFTGDWPSLTPGHARLTNLTTPADL